MEIAMIPIAADPEQQGRVPMSRDAADTSVRATAASQKAYSTWQTLGPAVSRLDQGVEGLEGVAVG